MSHRAAPESPRTSAAPAPAGEALEAALRARGLKRTAPRAAILDAFAAARGHVSVEELTGRVRERLPRVNPSTVYRTLNALVAAGVATARVFASGHKRFEVAGAGHHDHLVCTRCGEVVDFVDDGEIDRLQADIARRHGFRLSTRRVELLGCCARCCDEET